MAWTGNLLLCAKSHRGSMERMELNKYRLGNKYKGHWKRQPGINPTVTANSPAATVNYPTATADNAAATASRSALLFCNSLSYS